MANLSSLGLGVNDKGNFLTMRNTLKLCLAVVVFVSEVYRCFSLVSLPLPKVSIEKVTSDNCSLDEVKPDLMDIAVFRNGLVDVAMTISSKLEQRENYDKTAAAIKGVSIGVVVGIGFGIETYFLDDLNAMEAIQNSIGISIGLGVPLGLNSVTGNKVYLPTEEQARRGLIQDFVDGIWRNGDVSFVARVYDLKLSNGKYKSSNGVVAVCDTQLRNSPDSTKKYGQLPCHVHLMNMSVDEDVRCQGIATKVSFILFYI